MTVTLLGLHMSWAFVVLALALPIVAAWYGVRVRRRRAAMRRIIHRAGQAVKAQTKTP